jgi:hypothetical protein
MTLNGTPGFARAAAAALVLTLAAGPASAGQVVTPSRIDGLRDAIETEARYVEAEEFAGDRALLATLADLRDEVGFMRVSLRRGIAVADTDCRALEARLQRVREAIGRADAAALDRQAAAALEIPAGAVVDLRLGDPLSSADGTAPRHFQATTQGEVRDGNRVIVPAGSIVTGTASAVERSTSDGRAALAIALGDITVEDRIFRVPLRLTEVVGDADASRAIEFDGDVTVLTSARASVDLPAGAILRVRFESALTLTEHEH